MSQIYCPSCRAAQEPGASFCGNCGTRVASTTPQYGTPQHDSAMQQGSGAANFQGGASYGEPTYGGSNHGASNPGASNHAAPNYGTPSHANASYANVNPSHANPNYGNPIYGAPNQGAPLHGNQGHPPGPMPGALQGMVPAGFWIRFFANIIDSVILVVVQTIFALMSMNHWVVDLALSLAFTIGFWVTMSATPGKMALGLRIVRENGQPLDGGTAAVRYLGYFVSTILLLIGFIVIAFDDQKRGIHDRIAKTRVVKV